MLDDVNLAAASRRREVIPDRSGHELASTGLDEDHAFVRRAGADVALLAAGVRIRSRTRLVAGESCDLTELDVAQLHAFTDPRPAALHLARQLTGLAEDLLGLVTGDQIGDDQILNCRVPEAALPILRALDRGFGQVLNGRSDPGQSERHAARPSAATTLAWLLASGRHAVRISDVDEETRAELDELGRQGLVVSFNDAYRASDVALYGAFQRAAPTPRGY